MSKWKESKIIKLISELLFIISVAVLTMSCILLYFAYSAGALYDDYNSNEIKAALVHNEFTYEIEAACDEFFYNENEETYSYDYFKTNSENCRLMRNYLKNRIGANIWNADFYRFSVDVTFISEDNLSVVNNVAETYTDDYSYDYCDSYTYYTYPVTSDVFTKAFSTEEEMNDYIDEMSNKEADAYTIYSSGYDSQYDCYVLKYEIFHDVEVCISIFGYINTTSHDPVLDNYINKEPDIANNIKIADFIHTNRYALYIVAVFALLIFIVSFIISMCSSGHKKGVEGIYINWYERAPWEINIILFVTGVFLAVLAAFSVIENSCNYTNSYDSYFLKINLQILIGMTILFVCSAELVHILFRSIVVKIKARKGKDNILLVRFARKHIGKESRFRGFIRHMWENVTFMAKAIILYIVWTVLELIVIFGAEYISSGNIIGDLFLFLFVIKVIFTIIYFIFVVQIRMLYDGGKDLARGDFEHTIDTTYMFWCFKKHGEHLNSIKAGMSDAITERMKSERMKTELITNVSHDIKTPLTSIINYVDLLEKEGITDQPEASYIEVLKRHSQRLKKLIDDLVEASKASSGAISVNLEPMDVNMIVNQAAAEYMDKLMNNNINLMVSNSEESAYIMADGRHLWRVIDNLLNNAYKYAMPGTRLYVDINEDTDKVRIIFRNISKDQLNISSDELMERFVRGDQSRNAEGSGLGLSISLSLCQLMDADFEINIDGDLFKAIITFNRIEAPLVSNDEVIDKN